MSKFKTIDEILDFAILREQAAVDFYTRLSEKSVRQEIKKLLLSFADEEAEHKKKLESIKSHDTFFFEKKDITELMIADYTVAVEATPEMSFQDILIIAMKKEKAAFKLYTVLYEMTSNNTIKELFRALAQDEANHKLRFELLYEENFIHEG